MPEELGKIEKPETASFKIGRRLYFVPLIYLAEDTPEEFLEIYRRYWDQVRTQLGELESRLGAAKILYHELIPTDGEEGKEKARQLSEESHGLIESRMNAGARLYALENEEILTEFIDWTRCLSIGLQNANVMNTVYQAYQDASQRRDEYIARRIDETLGKKATGLLLMREGLHLQFPSDIEVFYVSPPALDEMKRWARERTQPEEDESAQES